MDSTLISEYIDKTIIDLNKYYPELLFGLDISTLKNQYINNYSSFEDFKVSFDLTVKNAISKFLNKQLDEKSKKNASFDDKIDQLTINISKKLVKTPQNNNNSNNSSGFVDTLILCLIVGFVMGVVAALAYMFIVNK